MTEEKAKEPYQQALAIKINDKNDFATFELGSNGVTVELLQNTSFRSFIPIRQFH